MICIEIWCHIRARQVLNPLPNTLRERECTYFTCTLKRSHLYIDKWLLPAWGSHALSWHNIFTYMCVTSCSLTLLICFNTKDAHLASYSSTRFSHLFGFRIAFSHSQTHALARNQSFHLTINHSTYQSIMPTINQSICTFTFTSNTKLGISI